MHLFQEAPLALLQRREARRLGGLGRLRRQHVLRVRDVLGPGRGRGGLEEQQVTTAQGCQGLDADPQQAAAGVAAVLQVEGVGKLLWRRGNVKITENIISTPAFEKRNNITTTDNCV